MRKLDQKLVRELSLMKAQAIAITLVIASGVAVFVMSMSSYTTLKHGQDAFYRDFRFADVFSNAERAPDSMIPRIEKIPGVATVEARLMYDVLLDVPEMVEPATAKLISVPESGENRLNHVYISRGRMLEPGRGGEVIVSEMFADAHGFAMGDQVRAIINGKRQHLTIVGVALSPEFVIQIQGGSLLPDKKRYGIFWMNQRELESAFDMSGAFNSVSLKLAFDANVDDVIARLDQLLEPFGSIGAYDRSENVSHQFVGDELRQLRTMATVAPLIFLAVAAFLLNIVISRIISQQREQIAALKAFGYTNYEVGFHYLNLVLIIAWIGMMVGTLLGLWMAQNLTQMYQEFYKFPRLTLQVDKIAILWALLLTTGIAVAGTYVAVRRAISLPPAEAMRPEPPPSFRPNWIERIFPTQWLPAEYRMVIRNVQRKPFKSLASVFGIGLSIAVLIVGSFTLDSLDYLIDFQFRKAQRQDLTIGFVQPATSSVMFELSQLPGVLDSETIRSVPARIRFQHRSRRIGVTGLQRSPRLFRLLDETEKSVEVPEQGIMLNTMLAGILGCQLGDMVTVDVLVDERPTVDLEVTALVNEFGGINAYMNKAQVHKVLNESAVASGAFLKVDANAMEEIYQDLESRPGIGSVTIKNAAIVSFRESVADNMLTIRSFNIFFAVVIAIGVVYNSARISLSEQSRDLATMRVVGFTQKEVSTVLLGEIGFFTFLAIPLGCLIGYLLAAALIMGLTTENYRIPLVVNSSTFAFSCLTVVIATVLSGVIVQRRVAKLDLVAVLKTRE
ncbi:MAG: FtsX-like permease family protein [Pirellulaceae bacterium]|nr:FtsX-like permease family protein [Pirellulaceae bacterium]